MAKKEEFERYFIGKKNRKECLDVFSDIAKIGVDFKINRGIKTPLLIVKLKKKLQKIY